MRINKVVLHNVPVIIVREKSSFEVNFLKIEEEKIAAELRPTKMSSIPLDKDLHRKYETNVQKKEKELERKSVLLLFRNRSRRRRFRKRV